MAEDTKPETKPTQNTIPYIVLVAGQAKAEWVEVGIFSAVDAEEAKAKALVTIRPDSAETVGDVTLPALVAVAKRFWNPATAKIKTETVEKVDWS